MKEQLIKFLAWYAEQNNIPNPKQHAKDLVSDYMDSITKVDESGIPESMTLYSNGNVMVFDKGGEQMGELQVNVDNFYFEFLELKGIDPTKVGEIRKVVNGAERILLPFKTEDGDWNCHFVAKK
jgi:hypothetical protein